MTGCRKLPSKDSLTVKGKCTIGTTYRQNTEVLCRGGLIRSSDEAPEIGVEQRG